MPTVTISDQPIHYARSGTGEPLLLIMGLSGNHRHWGSRFVAELEAHFDVIRFDNRGMGRSPRSAAPFAIADLAADAAGLLDELGLASAHVLGISMGGMIAQQLVLDRPALVRTLALGCTWAGGPGRVDTPRETVEAFGAAFASGDAGDLARVGWEHNVSPAFVRDPAALAELREIDAELPMPVDVVMAQLQAILGFDVSGRLGEIAAPTLVLHGTADRLIPFANGELLATAIAGARFERFDDVGHLFFWERPERSAALLREHAAAGAATAQGG